VTCGSTKDLQAGHFFSRKRDSTTFSLRNVHAQCDSCNTKHNNNPEPFRRFMVAKFGLAGLAELERLNETVRQYKDTDLKLIIEIIEVYQQELRKGVKHYDDL